MLESISARWPDVERISDQPNDTSKVIDTYVCIWNKILLVSSFLMEVFNCR